MSKPVREASARMQAATGVTHMEGVREVRHRVVVIHRHDLRLANLGLVLVLILLRSSRELFAEGPSRVDAKVEHEDKRSESW